MISQKNMISNRISTSKKAEEAIGKYFEEYRTYRYGNDLQIRAFNCSRMRNILINIDAFFDDIYIINGEQYIDIEDIGTVEFATEDNNAEILIKNIYFKNL